MKIVLSMFSNINSGQVSIINYAKYSLAADHLNDVAGVVFLNCKRMEDMK